MTPLQKFMQKDKIRVNAKIKAFYKSFKSFICCDDLPDFKIEYVDSREDNSIIYIAKIFPYHNPIILKYNIAYLNEKSKDFKTMLVHEFTHLYDCHILSKKYNEDFLKRNLSLYTEYHAVQIEILFCYNIVSKITEKADIFKADLTKVLDLPKQKNIIYSEQLFKYISNRNIKDFYTLKTTYMYAAGASSILSQLTKREFPTIPFEEPYKKQMLDVVNLLSSIRYNEIPSEDLLHKIGEIDAEMCYKL